MARQYYKDSTTGQMKPLGVKVEDTLPIGIELDYDGSTVPEGYVQVNETNLDNVVVNNIRNKNMFNKNNIVDNRRLNVTGDAYIDENYALSNYIEIEPNTTYTISGTTTNVYGCYATYTNNGTFIARSDFFTNTSTTFTAPSNAKYIRITDLKNNINTIQLEKGSSVTEYNSFQNLDGYEIYSTAEIRIGTWIDSKPLYRKVYNFGALPNNTSKSVALNISNLNEITSIRGICKNPNADFVTPIPIVFADGTNQLQVYVQSGQLSVYTSADRSSYTQSYIILEYTKTTDV